MNHDLESIGLMQFSCGFLAKDRAPCHTGLAHSKRLVLRLTEPAIRRELTKSNLFFALAFGR